MRPLVSLVSLRQDVIWSGIWRDTATDTSLFLSSCLPSFFPSFSPQPTIDVFILACLSLLTLLSLPLSTSLPSKVILYIHLLYYISQFTSCLSVFYHIESRREGKRVPLLPISAAVRGETKRDKALLIFVSSPLHNDHCMYVQPRAQVLDTTMETASSITKITKSVRASGKN